MPVRATKRGAGRTPLGGDADVLVCGASFAGLAVARELRATGARVLVLDRYEIGERQTSACAAPTEWLHALGVGAAIRQSFGSLVMRTARVRVRWPLPLEFSTFDYRQLCAALWEQCGDAVFETATVQAPLEPRGAHHGVRTDRGELRAPLVVDAMGWRRVLGAGAIQPPQAHLSRGLEVHPAGAGEDLELWVDRAIVRAGYGWSFPAGDEVRVGVGSFDPRDHVRLPTEELAARAGRRADAFQGNWIPHRLRPATGNGIFFAGDSAGHCIPLTAEGIRTALYFGVACGRELRGVLEGRQERAGALRRYHAFSAAHERKFELMLSLQDLIPRAHPHKVDLLARALARPRASHWAFGHYLGIARARFAFPAPARAPAVRRTPLPAAA